MTTVPGAYAHQLVQLVARWDVSEESLLEGLDRSAVALDDPNTRISISAFDELVRRARALTNEPGLGFYMGMQLRILSHGYLGVAAMAAGTVGEALAFAEQFIATRAPMLALRSFVEGESASVVLEEHASLGDELRGFMVTASLVTIAYAARFITGLPVTGDAEVTFSRPDCFDRFAHLLPGSVQFSRPSNRLVFARNILDLPLINADRDAAALAREQCERELAALALDNGVLRRVRSILVKEGFISLDAVAKRLQISPRTLKRKLASNDMTFSRVVEEIRRERALLLLGNSDLSIESIADMLGYADVTSFTRAFRRWTGTTPASVRRVGPE